MNHPLENLRPALLVAADDFTAGFKEVRLSYRAGQPPSGMPHSVCLAVPSRHQIKEATAKFAVDGDHEHFLNICLPVPWAANERFLEALDLNNLNLLIETSYQLAYGYELYSKIILEVTERERRGPQSFSE